ncbi:uncharacterized protein EDB91DRAFT_349610 [Suillus paluster]|uniref:uncharacterized protein n=1 Tax=Suillus paluster TaxID=48578 RepID=UPI001B85CAC1|nr:uncharacterized protein EDB91DRAFT_349610 [Suillus paluster]KAG1740448.1 hypothetical protein EDB91DRAFT_349610 [Suillus paluster]
MNSPQKKLLGWLKRSYSNPHLPVESGASESDGHWAYIFWLSPVCSDIGILQLSSLAPSPLRGPPGPVRKLWGKVTNRSTRSARQSPNPELAVASSSAQDLPPAQTTQVCATIGTFHVRWLLPTAAVSFTTHRSHSYSRTKSSPGFQFRHCQGEFDHCRPSNLKSPMPPKASQV